MRLSLLEHEAQQRREEERTRREGQASAEAPGADESASSNAQSGATASSVAYPSPRGSRADDLVAGASARSRSSTPASGQTDSSSPHETVVDDLNDIPHSIERHSGQSSLMTSTPVGNGETLTDHASSNDERSRFSCSTPLRGQGQRSDNCSGAIITSCTPFSSALSDADTSDHP